MHFSLFKDLSNLAKTGNFSQAAVLSHISQPTLTRRIQGLESWVGVPLVNRSKQPVSLTLAGEQILEAGEQSVARIEAERSQILETQSLPDRYIITFGTQHSLGWRFYPAWLQSFENAYGPIMSRLCADDLPNCMRDLQDGRVDFVIAYQGTLPTDSTRQSPNPSEQKTDSIIIGHDRLIPVCKPNTSGKPMFEINNGYNAIPFLQFGENAHIARLLDPLLEAKGLKPRLQTIYENSMAGALRIRARDGTGVAWLPKSLVSPDLESNLLVHTGEPDWELELEIRLFRRNDNSNHLTRAIWDYLKTRSSQPLIHEE